MDWFTFSPVVRKQHDERERLELTHCLREAYEANRISKGPCLPEYLVTCYLGLFFDLAEKIPCMLHSILEQKHSASIDTLENIRRNLKM